MKKIYFVFCLLVLMVSTKIDVFGQILAWDFAGGDPKAASFSSTYNNPNIEVSTLTRGAGASSNTASYSNGVAISFTGSAQDYATAKQYNSYVEFKMLSKTHYTSLSDLDVKLRIYINGTTIGTAADKYRWTYRKTGQTVYTGLGNEENTIASSLAPNDDSGITQPTLDLVSVTDLQNIAPGDTVTFRLYAWGGSGASSAATTAIGKSGGSLGSNSLMLRGVTSSSPITLSANAKIVGWEYSSLSSSSTVTPDPSAATSSNGNLSTYALTRGAGLTGVALQRGFGSTLGTSSTNLSAAIAANEYYQIALSANAGYYTTLSSMLYRVVRAADGPASYQWKYSIDGGTNFVDIGVGGTFSAPSTGADGIDMYLDMQDIVDLKNVPSTGGIILRMYVWGNTSSTSVFGFGKFNHATNKFNSIYIKGTVSNTLPVTLTSFKATKQSNSVRLNWVTASEQNNSYFTVLRAGDDKNFLPIGKVNGNGTTNITKEYSLADYKPLAGSNYYKLSQTDFDGTTKEIGEVQHITFDFSSTSLTVVQQTEQSTVKATLNAAKADKANFAIYNISGNALYQVQLNINSGINEILAPVSLNKGVYILKVKTQSGETWQAKFVK